jgi:hypothetical protein
MAQAPVVDVVGLRALSRDLARAADSPTSPLLKALKDAGNRAATPIAEVARSAVPHDSGRLSSSVRVSAARTGASVRMGRASVPYAGPVEFGGYPGSRPYLPAGRYLFPAAGDLATQAATDYADALQRGLDAINWTNPNTDPRGVHD